MGNEFVELRTGVFAPAIKVKEVTEILDYLIEENMLAYDNLVELCRNPNHRPLLSAELSLKDYSLLRQDGSIDDAIRNIVIASTEGSGWAYDLVSPFTGELTHEYSCF